MLAGPAFDGNSSSDLIGGRPCLVFDALHATWDKCALEREEKKADVDCITRKERHLPFVYLLRDWESHCLCASTWSGPAPTITWSAGGRRGSAPTLTGPLLFVASCHRFLLSSLKDSSHCDACLNKIQSTSSDCDALYVWIKNLIIYWKSIN